MTAKEHLDSLTNKEYDNKLTADAFLYMADGGMYPYKMEELAIQAAEDFAKQETEQYVAVLTAIANQTDEQVGWTDAGVRMRDLARKALKLK